MTDVGDVELALQSRRGTPTNPQVPAEHGGTLHPFISLITGGKT
jgi:hypothetical protein